MKKTLTVIVASLAAASVFAGPAKPAKAPTELKCAVMGEHMVNIKKATASKMYADYKGNRYFFCCGGCVTSFKANPAKFAKAPHIPTPKGK
jgi:YHS domain-containing protein